MEWEQIVQFMEVSSAMVIGFKALFFFIKWSELTAHIKMAKDLFVKCMCQGSK